MLLAIALAVTPSPQARLDELIAQWCSVRSTSASATCVALQTNGLRRFLAVSTVLDDPDRALATACLRKSAKAPSLDWAIAGRCLSDAADFHHARWRNPDRDSRLTSLPDIRWVPFAPGVR